MDTFAMFEQIEEREFANVSVEAWDEFFAEGKDSEQ